jgi:beta-glucosidase
MKAAKKVASSSPAPVPVPNSQLADHALNLRVEELIRKMTLEEKIGQLVQYSAGGATGPQASNATYEDLIARGQVGSLFNVIGAEKTNHYQKVAMEKSRLHIPLLFGYDVIHGYRTGFPVPLALAASFDPSTAEEVARTSAREARADGIQWVFSPMVDIARDARWGRIVESSGEDPYLGSAMARAWVKGYQQGDLSKPDSVAACVKHFAAYGAAVAGRDYNAVDLSELTLRQVYFPPYRAAVEAGAATVMSSFNSVNGVPSSVNRFLLTQVLRREWGFQGFVVSDWRALQELMNHSVAADGATAASKAITAGLDMDMEGGIYAARLASLVRGGQVPESVVDESVRRVLRVKFALGLFEHPYAPATQGQPPQQPTEDKRERARRIAEETIVLLKNEPLEGVGKLLPVLKTPKNVALIGPLADSAENMLGSWTAQSKPEFAVTLRTALAEKWKSSQLLYAKGADILGDNNAGFGEAVDAAKKADLVILALGESGPQMTGEAASRAHLDLPGNQQQLLEAVVATGKPVILVLFNGRPLAVPWADKHVAAIVEAWYPGIEAGHAVVNILSGEVNPSGKLPVSFPYSVGQEPLYLAQLPTGRPATGDLSHPPQNAEEKYQSRYIDEPNSPVYPFGWGLSYTQFSYSPITVSRQQVPVKEILATKGQPVVRIGVDVKNTGRMAGTEVVQLYLRNTAASVEQPVRELKGFARITLQPGEQKHIEFPLGFDELSFYNSDSARTVEPTTFKLWIGGNSQATEEAAVEIIP